MTAIIRNDKNGKVVEINILFCSMNKHSYIYYIYRDTPIILVAYYRRYYILSQL